MACFSRNGWKKAITFWSLSFIDVICPICVYKKAEIETTMNLAVDCMAKKNRPKCMLQAWPNKPCTGPLLLADQRETKLYWNSENVLQGLQGNRIASLVKYGVKNLILEENKFEARIMLKRINFERMSRRLSNADAHLQRKHARVAMTLTSRQHWWRSRDCAESTCWRALRFCLQLIKVASKDSFSSLFGSSERGSGLWGPWNLLWVLRKTCASGGRSILCRSVRQSHSKPGQKAEQKFEGNRVI